MSATPEQIAEPHSFSPDEIAQRIEHFGASFDLDVMKQAAALIRAQAERMRVLEALLQRLEPSIGWRSATGTSRDFACEFCHQTHAHFAHIEHTDACPVTQVRAALKAAP